MNRQGLKRASRVANETPSIPISLRLSFQTFILSEPHLCLSLSLPPGYLIMTDEWFSEYVYEVVVDKSFVAPEVLEVMHQDPIVLPAWDPMGALA